MSKTDLSRVHNTMKIQRTLDHLHQIYIPFVLLFVQVLLLADLNIVFVRACGDR
jgi:hypothetical protein